MNGWSCALGQAIGPGRNYLHALERIFGQAWSGVPRTWEHDHGFLPGEEDLATINEVWRELLIEARAQDAVAEAARFTDEVAEMAHAMLVAV
jgi:hypothetical protein